MCPDRQLVSMYIDGEVPSPWKEKLEAHLSACPACAAKADEFRALSGALRGPEPVSEASAAAAERVWSRLEERMPRSAKRRPAFWRRPLILPVPAAVAAAIAVAALAAGGAGALMASKSASGMPSVSMDTNRRQAIPVSDMRSVLRYLDAQDQGGNIVIIKLPENSDFAPGGEPTLIRAADYTGSASR